MTGSGVILAISALVVCQISGKSLHRKHFKKLVSCNGTELCVGDRPATVLSPLCNQPVAGNVCLPPTIICARKCTQDALCIGYKADIRLCEMYDVLLALVSAQPGCIHFEIELVENISILVIICKYRASMTKLAAIKCNC